MEKSPRNFKRNPLVRVLIVDRILSSQKWYTYAQLLSEVNQQLYWHYGEGMDIADRQLRYDISYLIMDFAAPIQYEKSSRQGGAHRFRYCEPFSMCGDKKEVNRLKKENHLLRKQVSQLKAKLKTMQRQWTETNANSLLMQL